MPPILPRALHALAGLYGVQTAYTDISGRRQYADPEVLLLTLRLLGAPLATLTDVTAALRARRLSLWQRGVEPVVVVWEGQPVSFKLRLPAASMTGGLVCHLYTETGDYRRWENDMVRLPTVRATQVEGIPFQVKRLLPPWSLPLGYHRLTLETSAQQYELLLMVAPQRVYMPPQAMKEWGVFLPAYAGHSTHSWGSGDFSDLEAFTAWLADLGGGVYATLPLLSSFLDELFEPSPYVPVSRLFWNELYVDVTRAPGFEECPEAEALLRSSEVQATLAELRSARLVDYRRHMALKRSVLAPLAQWFFKETAHQDARFRHFVATHPAVEDYARFRATSERQRTPWPSWPAPLCDGVLTTGDYDEQARRYHLYVQWVAHEQLTMFAERSKAAGVKLYLDLPLGAHPHGYDVWRERAIFVREAAAGAPPDSFFTTGQNWGFPPLHPETIRAQGYRYCIAYLRQQLQYTGLLRIDHVMGLHRLFWIPHGLEARQGLYVHYAAKEFYAMVTLESQRYQVRVVGENLGTVPSYVNTAMAKHRLHRMYVMQYELSPSPQSPLRPVSPHTVASLNTHDMPPFAAYWQGLDIADRVERGLLSQAESLHERQARQALLEALQYFLRDQGFLANVPAAPAAVLQASLAFLSASAAQVILVNCEDLWLDTQQQNYPGTYDERPNWRQKARYSLETLRQMPQVLATLRTISQLRTPGEGAETRTD
jgi:4-alpha-glucanotransferase